MSSKAENSQLAIMFVDIVGSSALYKNEGDAEALDVIGKQITLFEDIVSDYYGRTVKKIGDAILARFDSPSQAVLAAMQMRKFAQMKEAGFFEGEPLKIKVGVHYGPVLEQDNDIFGNAVNVASRLTSTAGTQQVLLTRQVLNELTEDMGQMCRFLEKTQFKGIPEDYEVFEIVMNEDVEGLTTSVSDLQPEHLVFTRIIITYQGMTKEFSCKQGSITLGRDAANDVVVATPNASRHHGKIEFRKGKFILKDMSVNASYLKDMSGGIFKIHRDEMTLPSDGQILIGKSSDEGNNCLRFICG